MFSMTQVHRNTAKFLSSMSALSSSALPGLTSFWSLFSLRVFFWLLHVHESNTIHLDSESAFSESYTSCMCEIISRCHGLRSTGDARPALSSLNIAILLLIRSSPLVLDVALVQKSTRSSRGIPRVWLWTGDKPCLISRSWRAKYTHTEKQL